MTDKCTPELWLSTTIAEEYAGSQVISLPVARALVAQSSFDPASTIPKAILDIGTGPGVVPDAIMALGPVPGVKVLATDIDKDDSLLAFVDEKIKTNGWDGRVETKKMGVMDLKTPDNQFDYVFANFLYMLLPKPMEALKESIRTLKPGGQLGFSTWAHPGPFYTLQLAAALIPAFPNMRTIEAAQHMYAGGYWHDAAFVRKALEDLGMVDIQIETFLYAHEAETPAAMARQCWPLCKMFAAALGGGEASRVEGWKLFGKIEEILKLEFGNGPTKIASAALIVTARKPE